MQKVVANWRVFGSGYRLSDRNWNKVMGGNFFNPMHQVDEIDGSNVMMFHAKDDPYHSVKTVVGFAKQVGATLTLLFGRSSEQTNCIGHEYLPSSTR